MSRDNQAGDGCIFFISILPGIDKVWIGTLVDAGHNLFKIITFVFYKWCRHVNCDVQKVGLEYKMVFYGDLMKCLKEYVYMYTAMNWHKIYATCIVSVITRFPVVERIHLFLSRYNVLRPSCQIHALLLCRL